MVVSNLEALVAEAQKTASSRPKNKMPVQEKKIAKPDKEKTFRGAPQRAANDPVWDHEPHCLWTINDLLWGHQ